MDCSRVILKLNSAIRAGAGAWQNYFLQEGALFKFACNTFLSINC